MQTAVPTPTVQELEATMRAALEADSLAALVPQLGLVHAAELADALQRLDIDDRLRLFPLLNADTAADVLHHLGSDAAHRLLDGIDLALAGTLLDRLPMDDVAALLTGAAPERRAELLGAMRREDAAEVNLLLQYPPNSAGRLATEKFPRAVPEMTVTDTFNRLRQVHEDCETLTDIYVLDERDRLIGVVALSRLVISEPSARLRDLMAVDIISVTPFADREEAARLVARYDFLALPVLYDDGRMLGIITVDDLIHVLVEENTEDALRFGAVEPGPIDQPYFTVPLQQVVRTRIGWLLVLFVGQSITGQVLQGFEAQLDQMVALAFYIPMLIGMGGNAGAQTVSTIIRGLALREIQFRDLGRVFRRELTGGLLLGLALGIITFVQVFILGTQPLALVVGISIAVIILWANCISSLIPLLAQRFKIDPALVSAPLITTIVDATGLAIYLLLARALLGF